MIVIKIRGHFNMFKKILTLAVILLAVPAVSAKEIRIIQVTDSHFTTLGQGYSQRDVTPSQRVLENTIKDINKISDKSFVVFTGDNIDKPNDEDLKAFLKVANKLNCPYYMVIGNHEASKYQKFSKKDYLKIVRRHSKNCKSKEANYVFKHDGMVFFGS